MVDTVKELEAFHELAQVITVSIDDLGRIRYINAHGSELLGYTQSELINRSWIETCIPAHERQVLMSLFENFMAGDVEGLTFHQNAVLTRSGQEKVISWHNMPRRNSTGQVIGSYSTGIDISALMDSSRQEHALGEMLENALNEIYIVDAKSLAFLHVNKTALANSDLTMAEQRALSFVDLVAKSWQETFSQYIYAVASGAEQAGPFETTFKRPDDGEYPVEVFIHSAHYGGRPALIVYAQDISKRKQAQTQLVASESKFQTILDTAAEGIIVINQQNNIESLNKAAQQLFCLTDCQVENLPFTQLLSPESQEAFDQFITPFLTPELDFINASRIEVLARKQNDEYFPVEISAARVDVPYPIITLIIHDLTQRKEAEAALRNREQELQNLREQLYHSQRVNQMNAVANGIAHEINQPLAAITTYAETCKKIASTAIEPCADVVTSLEQISLQARRAGDIVHHLRDIMKKQSSKRENTELNQLIEQTVELIKPELKQHQIHVDWHLADKPIFVNIDNIQIQQVLLNLLLNSTESLRQCDADDRKIKIVTEISPAPGHLQQNLVKCSIQDNGDGVPEGDVEKIFKPFTSTKSNGLGLGLSICRDIIERHNGELALNVGFHPGCEFYFTLPLAD